MSGLTLNHVKLCSYKLLHMTLYKTHWEQQIDVRCFQRRLILYFKERVFPVAVTKMPKQVNYTTSSCDNTRFYHVVPSSDHSTILLHLQKKEKNLTQMFGHLCSFKFFILLRNVDQIRFFFTFPSKQPHFQYHRSVCWLNGLLYVDN